MARTALTGSRIRERRTAIGQSQAALARAVEISPSYLNLIEHNRRRIGGKLLNAIARELRIDPVQLTEGAGASLLNALRDAAVGHGAATEELDRIEEFAGRFPGWAGLLADTRRRVLSLEQNLEALSDRLAHDPALSASLHEVISTVTAIQSSAAILKDTPDLDTEWQARFHRNISEDSQRLADGAQGLVRFLEGAERTEAEASTPQEEFDNWLSTRNYRIAELEESPDRRTQAIIDAAPELASEGARVRAKAYLAQYARDVKQLPTAAGLGMLMTGDADPARIARERGVDLATMLRRLATVPRIAGTAEMGLVSCDASGTLTFRKPIDRFPLPRLAPACALWPLYEALSRPMTPIRRVVRTAGRLSDTFLAFAICQPSQPAEFDRPQVLEAHMLIVPRTIATLPYDGNVVRIGSSCRVCAQSDCPARREPSIVEMDATAPVSTT